jgi:hypothetical protein
LFMASDSSLLRLDLGWSLDRIALG